MADIAHAGKQFQSFVIKDRARPNWKSLQYPTKERAQADVLIAQSYAHANDMDVPDMYVENHR